MGWGPPVKEKKFNPAAHSIVRGEDRPMPSGGGQVLRAKHVWLGLKRGLPMEWPPCRHFLSGRGSHPLGRTRRRVRRLQ